MYSTSETRERCLRHLVRFPLIVLKVPRERERSLGKGLRLLTKILRDVNKGDFLFLTFTLLGHRETHGLVFEKVPFLPRSREMGVTGRYMEVPKLVWDTTSIG